MTGDISPAPFRAAVWRGESTLAIETLRLGPLDPHSVTIRVQATDVNTSEHITLRPENRGAAAPLPQVLGHGSVGVVVALGSEVRDLSIGDRVIATASAHCGSCHNCLTGRAYLCAKLSFVGPTFAHTDTEDEIFAASSIGGFAEVAVVPRIQLTPVTTELPSEALALLAVGYGSGIGAALIVAPITAGSVVAAVGLGVSGQAYVQAARLAGATTIIGIDPHEHRRRRALESGATHVVDPGDGDPVEAVRRIGGDFGGPQGSGADFVFESAANTRGIQQAWEMTRGGGDLVLSSIPYDMMTATVTFPAVPFAIFGRSVHASQYGNLNIHRDLPWIIRLIEAGQLNPMALLDARCGLDGVNQAIDDVAHHKALGSTVTFDGNDAVRTHPDR